MPEKLERQLKEEAHQKGFKTGGKRYNAYVYGTLNKMGMLNSNHAGALAPERILKNMKFDYTSTNPNVKGIHIGIAVTIVLLIYWFTKGTNILNPQMPEQNGNGATAFINTANYGGWIEYQYHSLGAKAGDIIGQSN